MVRLFLSPHTSGCEQLSQSRLLRTLFTLRSLERQEKPDHGFTVFIGRSLWHTNLIEEGMSLHRSVWGATPYGGVRTKEADVRVSCGLRLPYMTDELYQLMLSCWMTDRDQLYWLTWTNSTANLTDIDQLYCKSLWTVSICLLRYIFVVTLQSHWLQLYCTFSWTESICSLRLCFHVALKSHRLQLYLTFPWTESIYAF